MKVLCSQNTIQHIPIVATVFCILQCNEELEYTPHTMHGFHKYSWTLQIHSWKLTVSSCFRKLLCLSKLEVYIGCLVLHLQLELTNLKTTERLGNYWEADKCVISYLFAITKIFPTLLFYEETNRDNNKSYWDRKAWNERKRIQKIGKGTTWTTNKQSWKQYIQAIKLGIVS